MELSENVADRTSWINFTEMLKLDSSELSDVPSTTFENLSTNFNSTLNASLNPGLSQQSWITASSIIPLYSVIFLLAVIGNSLVILTLVQNKRMRTITNLFLLNLAVSDLFLGVFCMPFTLVGMLLRDFIFGELMCKLLPYLQGWSMTQSALIEEENFLSRNYFNKSREIRTRKICVIWRCACKWKCILG